MVSPSVRKICARANQIHGTKENKNTGTNKQYFLMWRYRVAHRTIVRISEVSARRSLMHELNIRHQSAPDQLGKDRNVCAQPDHMRDISFIHPPPFTSYNKINFCIYAKVFQFDSFLYIVFTSCLGTACNCNLRMRSSRIENQNHCYEIHLCKLRKS